MAVHRRVTLPNLSNVPFNPNRPNTLEQERLDFERNQLNAILKSLSVEEAAPKEKHVRTLIMGTYSTQGGSVFLRYVKDYASLHANEVVLWKFLVILYRVLQDGQANVVKDTFEDIPFIDQMSKYHRNSRTEFASYGRLSAILGQLVINKLKFFQKYPDMPCNFAVKDNTLSAFDTSKNFELAIDLLDLLESIIQLKKHVLDTFPPAKANSMTASGQCRLSAVITCTHDSSKIVDVIGKMFRVLHRHLPWDTLAGHRQRFKDLYDDLRKIYIKLSTIQYLRGILQVPELAGDLSHFFNSLHRINEEDVDSHDKGSVNLVEDDPNDGMGNLISIQQVDDAHMQLQSDYNELLEKYQHLIEAFQEEQFTRKDREQELQSRQMSYQRELDTLKKQHEMAIEAASAAASTSTSIVEESAKLEKLKSAYQKLRQEHINLLRQRGDSDKELHNLQSSLSKMSERSENLEAAIKEFLGKVGIQHGTDLVSMLQGASLKMEALSAQIEEKERQLNQFNEERENVVSTEKSSMEEMNLEKKRLDLEIDNLNQQITQLQSEAQASRENFDESVSAWKQHLEKSMKTLLSYLQNFPQKNPPSVGEIFDRDVILAELGGPGTTHLATVADLVFYLMLALLKLQPYANAETFDLKEAIRLAATFVEILQSDNSPGAASNWNMFYSEICNVTNCAKGIKWDPTDAVDKEIYDMQATIEEAAAALEKLMLEARANEQSKPNIDVDMKILDSCSKLFAAIQEVIKNGRKLQNEITSESIVLGSNSRPEFYRKNQKWSEGLISASKDIGRGAKLLVESANAVVNEQGKFEELIAASQEIASSTAQMVVASKVKARKDSTNLAALSSASKRVAEATAQVIATSRACHADAENEAVDLEKLSVHQSKKLEMEIQIKVLELESQLERERKKLFSLRKLQYSNNNNE